MLDASMLAAHGSGSGGSLSDQGGVTLLITLVGVLIASASLVLQYLNGVLRRRFIYGVTVSAQIVDPSVAHPNLHVLWRDEEVTDPHILEIDLVYKGRGDITSPSFDKGRPLSLDINAPIIDLLETIVYPARAPVPKVEATGTSLKIGPDLLRKRQAFKFVVLVDGPGGQLSCENPIANVKEKEARHPAQELGNFLYRKQKGRLRTVITWTALIFIVFYLVTQPTSSGEIINSAFNAVQSAGASLARFVNSLPL